MATESGQCSLKPGISRSHQTPEEAGEDPPLELPEEDSSADTVISDFWLLEVGEDKFPLCEATRFLVLIWFSSVTGWDGAGVRKAAKGLAGHWWLSGRHGHLSAFETSSGSTRKSGLLELSAADPLSPRQMSPRPGPGPASGCSAGP